MARRRIVRSARVSRSARSRQRAWFGVLADATQPLNSFAVTNILSPADYAQGNLASKVLLETIYLELAVAPAALAGGCVNWAVFGLMVVDQDVGTGATQNDPDNASNLAEERWLWTTRTVVPQTCDGALRWAVHVKQKVKLDDMQVRFVASNSDPAEAFDYSFHARLLVRT